MSQCLVLDAKQLLNSETTESQREVKDKKKDTHMG